MSKSLLYIMFLIPELSFANLPWNTNAESTGTGVTLIDYNKAPTPGISVFYSIPYQLTELSIRKLMADTYIGSNIFSLELAQSGNQMLNETLLTISAGRQLSDIIYFKIACSNFHIKSINGAKGNTIITEVQLLYQPFSNLIIGSHLFNPTGSVINSDNRDFKIDRSFRLGSRYLPIKNFSFIMEFEKILGEEPIWHLGSEYKIMNALKIRFGFTGKPLIITWGFSLKHKTMEFSTGASQHPVLGLTTAFSVKHYWNKTASDNE